MAITDTQLRAKVISTIGKHEVTLAGTVVRGDVLGYSSGWKRALATVGGVIQGRCIALEDGVSGDVINVALAAIVGGQRYTGATAGARIYVAEGTSNGKITETVPTTQNDATTIIGHAIDATTLALYPGLRGLDTLAP